MQLDSSVDNGTVEETTPDTVYADMLMPTWKSMCEVVADILNDAPMTVRKTLCAGWVRLVM